MNAPLVFLLTFFLTATAIPISDGTTDSSIVTPADFASADVTPTDFNPADVALADVPSVASGDDTSIGSASTESTGVDSESVASNPGCATTSQTQGFLQPGGDISTDISPTTHASLAVAVQDGFCPNPNQSPGSGNNPNNDEEKNPSGRRRQYKELEELKRKLCCKLEPKESVNFVAYGKTYPVINYGVCHEYDPLLAICKLPINWFLCFKFHKGTIFNKALERVLDNDGGFGWGQQCIQGIIGTYD